MKALLLFRAAGSFWFLTLLAPGMAQAAVPSKSAFQVVSIGQPQTVSSQQEASRYDVGFLSGFAPRPIVHIFALQNDSARPLTVTEVRPTCGCASVILPSGRAKTPLKLPLALPPGQQLPVQVTMDAAHLSPGAFTKAVWVYVKGQDAPAATLEITGTLLSAAKFSPAALDFGRISYGSSPARSLAVTLETEALPSHSQPRLVCSNSDVQITPAPVSASPLPQAAASSPPATPHALTYQLTLSPRAHLGQLRGDVEVVLADPNAGSVTLGSVPIDGEVIGEVAASPSVVAFGTVTAGQSASRQIMLTLAKTQTLTLTSASPYLSAVARPVTASHLSKPFGSTAPVDASAAVSQSGEPEPPQAAQEWLTITLGKRASPGPLETELTVTTESGQHLRVPVFAVVTTAQVKP